MSKIATNIDELLAEVELMRADGFSDTPIFLKIRDEVYPNLRLQEVDRGIRDGKVVLYLCFANPEYAQKKNRPPRRPVRR